MQMILKMCNLVPWCSLLERFCGSTYPCFVFSCSCVNSVSSQSVCPVSAFGGSLSDYQMFGVQTFLVLAEPLRCLFCYGSSFAICDYSVCSGILDTVMVLPWLLDLSPLCWQVKHE